MERTRHALSASLALALLCTAANGQAKLYGNSCAGASGTDPTIGVQSYPLADQPYTIDIHGLPNKAGLLLFGTSDAFWGPNPLPFDLTPLGLGGCDLNVSPDLQIPIFFDANGDFTLNFSLWGAGLSGYFQAYVFDFQFPTHFGSLTEGLKLTPKNLSQVGKGEILITEFMQNPVSVADVDGEWVELYNTTDQDIDIEDWQFGDDFLDLWLLQNNDQGIIVPAHSYFVLGFNDDPLVNGGVPVGYEYDNVFMKEGTDTISLREKDGTLQDKLTYVAGWPKGPGFACGLNPDKSWNQAMNDNPANWCGQASPLTGGDLGTPGAVNDSCP